MLPLIVILALVAANALYVAAEFSTVSARRSRVRQLAQEGNRSAIWLLPVIEDARRLDRYVAACQIGITLSSIVLGAYGQATLPGIISPWLSDLGGLREEAAAAASATIIIIALSSFQVLFGELLPKTLSLQFTTQTALLCTAPMAFSMRLYSWFIAILNGSGLFVLRLLGAGEGSHRHIHSPEEIQLLFVESREGGLLAPDEQGRLVRALALAQQSVGALMTPRTRVSSLNIARPMDEIVEQVTASPYTRFPVYEGSLDNIVGVLHSKDLVRQRLENGSGGSIRTLLRPPVLIPESISADRALATLRTQRSQIAVVLGEHGGAEGLITLNDLLSEVLEVRADQLPTSEKLPDGRIRINGRMRLENARLWIGSDLDTEAATVAGLVIERLGHLPDPGEHVTISGSRLEVETVSGHAIQSLLIAPSTDGAADDGGADD